MRMRRKTPISLTEIKQNDRHDRSTALYHLYKKKLWQCALDLFLVSDTFNIVYLFIA